MKCLSLRQPYAELLVSGKKTIELRSWNTKFRGQFLIHASKKIDEEACERNAINPSTFVTGALIGKATLYEVKLYSDAKALSKDRAKHLAGVAITAPKYGFLVQNARKFKRPIPAIGKLGFFEVDN